MSTEQNQLNKYKIYHNVRRTDSWNNNFSNIRWNHILVLPTHSQYFRLQGEQTLCGRLGEALKSDAYVDLGSSALARVLVGVSG